MEENHSCPMAGHLDLPVSDSGNHHVVVFQDFLMKWPLVFPVLDQKAVGLVKLLTEEVIPLFGVPEAVLSDREVQT